VFGFTETKLGILPAVISPYVLPKIGPSAARELFLTGMRFPASRAKEIGLVHAVVSLSQLDSAIDIYVKELLSASPAGIAASKALIPKVWGRSPADAASITSNAIAAQRVSPEGQEGLRAFLDKRKPSFSGD
jgi:methylglutaconyl-CoA hydratase